MKPTWTNDGDGGFLFSADGKEVASVTSGVSVATGKEFFVVVAADQMLVGSYLSWSEAKAAAEWLAETAHA